MHKVSMIHDLLEAGMGVNVLSELKESNLDIAAYDTVFVGYPMRAVPIRQ